MPQKRKIRLNNISAVPAAAAAGVALIDIPLSFGRCHEIHIGYGHASGTNTIAAALAFVEEIRVILNGTVVRTMSGAQLRDQNVQNGSAYDMTGLPNTTVGVDMPIFFAEPWRKDVRDPGQDRALSRMVIERLCALGLARREGDLLFPLPAIGRYGLREEELTESPVETMML